MVRSDKACAGVMFSIDTETGFPDVVLLTGARGLGETVVQGSVTPDQSCHAAIVSRELGIPAVIGTGDASRVLTAGQEVTLSCAEGDQGYI